MQSASATARRSGALQLAWERAKCADSTAVSFVAEHRRHRCDLAARLVCSCGRGGILWAGIAAAAAARTRGTTAAVTAAGTVATAFAASAALARLLGRRRPFEQAGSVRPLGAVPSGPSLPSDQAASAAAGAFVLSRLVPAVRPAAVLAVVSTGAARVYVGAHYPSDVIGGAALGAATASFWSIGYGR